MSHQGLLTQSSHEAHDSERKLYQHRADPLYGEGTGKEHKDPTPKRNEQTERKHAHTH